MPSRAPRKGQTRSTGLAATLQQRWCVRVAAAVACQLALALLFWHRNALFSISAGTCVAPAVPKAPVGADTKVVAAGPWGEIDTAVAGAGARGVLLSYPRSGNHLVRVLIEYLTQRATLGYAREGTKPLTPAAWQREWGVVFHDNDVVALKAHSLRHRTDRLRFVGGPPGAAAAYGDLGAAGARGGPFFLVWVLRDPLEAAASDNEDWLRVYQWWVAKREQDAAEFRDAAAGFDAWAGPKMRLHLESLLDPAQRSAALRALASFFDVPAARADEVTARWEEIADAAAGLLQRGSYTSSGGGAGPGGAPGGSGNAAPTPAHASPRSRSWRARYPNDGPIPVSQAHARHFSRYTDSVCWDGE